MMLGLTMRMTRKEYPGADSELRDAIACDWPRFLERALPDMPYRQLSVTPKDSALMPCS